MKTVGKQLQEARLARSWTPELAARETKIKIERLKDLEADDYSQFASATYARGFVRTYARALGLDEYSILRQLDNKLPDDDSANIVSAEGGVAYVPGTGLPPRAAHRDYTGLYVVMALGGMVALAIVFVLFEAYRVGELSRWMGSDTTASASASTNAGPAVTSTGDEAPARAKPIDSNTPPPIDEPVATNTVAGTAPPIALPADTNASSAVPPRALPVDLSKVNDTPSPAPAPVPVPAQVQASTATPPPADVPVNAPRAQPVSLADLNNAPPPAVIPANANPPAKIPPRALPVNPADLADDAANTGEAATPKPVLPAAQTPANDPVRPTIAAPPVEQPPMNPADAVAKTDNSGQPLVLTASRDSFVRVTALDTAGGDKAVYAAVLHSGQSVGFNGHKFSVNVDNPSAIDIKLDGVNYGPHSDTSAPETFTVVSHVQ